MRITNGILQQNALREIQRNLSELAEAQRQVATGRRHDRVSDDPLAGTQVVRHDAALRALEQHRRNATAVRARLDAEEAVLGQLDALLTRAKELGTEQASGGTGAVGRAAAVAELDRILEQVIQLGNTELGGEHLFGGYLVDAPPFDPTGAYLGDDGVRQAELGAGYVIDTVHSGRRIFVDTGVIASVRQLRGAVQGGDTAAIATALTAVDGAFDGVQALTAEIGARLRQVDAALATADALESSHTVARSQLADVPIEEATVRFATVQNALQAALLATTRVLNLNLTEYLR